MPTYAFIGSGQLALDLPEGTHEIILQLRNTTLQSIAYNISSAAILGLILRVYLENKASTHIISWTRLS